MRLGEYAITFLLIIQILGVVGVWAFKTPPVEYIPYIGSIIVVWFIFGVIIGSEPK